MSDEYAASGYKGSLVNNSINDTADGRQITQSQAIPPRRQNADFDSDNQNYPPEGDTTSSGGYGSPKNVWSDRAQRGNTSGVGSHQAGLIDQSVNGGQLKDQIQDAKQGQDVDARRDYQPGGSS